MQRTDIFWDSKCNKSIELTHMDEKSAYTQDGIACRMSLRTGAVKVLSSSENTITNIGSLKEEKEMEKKSIREIVSTVFKALTLAMGVAVVVLSCMGSLNEQTAVTLLGIGLASAGVAMLEKQ